MTINNNKKRIKICHKSINDGSAMAMMCGRDEEPDKCNSPLLKNCYDLCTLQGYGHVLLRINNIEQTKEDW